MELIKLANAGMEKISMGRFRDALDVATYLDPTHALANTRAFGKVMKDDFFDRIEPGIRAKILKHMSPEKAADAAKILTRGGQVAAMGIISDRLAKKFSGPLPEEEMKIVRDYLDSGGAENVEVVNLPELTQHEARMENFLKKFLPEKASSFMMRQLQKNHPAYYDPRVEQIRPGSSLPTALHEAGHAKNKLMFGKGHKAWTALRHLPLISALRRTLASDIENPVAREIFDFIEKVEYTPILMEEGMASARALKKLYELRGVEGVREGLRSLAPAFGTYAFPAAQGKLPNLVGEAVLKWLAPPRAQRDSATTITPTGDKTFAFEFPSFDLQYPDSLNNALGALPMVRNLVSLPQPHIPRLMLQ